MHFRAFGEDFRAVTQGNALDGKDFDMLDTAVAEEMGLTAEFANDTEGKNRRDSNHC